MNPNYYTITPATVRYDKRLKDKAIILYGEITALTNKQGFCWASNEYFAHLYDLAPETVSRLINQLAKYEHIFIEIKNGNKRRITIDKKVKECLTESSRALDQIVKPSIYSINNTINTDGSALNFVIKNYPIRFEQEFLMQFEKQFKSQEQFDAYLRDFNDEAEGKNFDVGLVGMLKKYARNWLKFQANKSSKVVDMMPTFKKIG